MPDGRGEPGEGVAGFEPWPRTSPFGDAAGPLLFRRDALTFAVPVEERHTNATGGAHGGMLSAFADMVLGYAAAFSTDPPTPLTTVALAVHFVGPVSVGDLVTATPEVLRVGSRLAHASAIVRVGDVPVARASSTMAVVGEGRKAR